MSVLLLVRRRPRVAVIFKHLPGRHNQKRHGNRYHSRLEDLFCRAVAPRDFQSRDPSRLLAALGPSSDDRRVHWVVAPSLPAALAQALKAAGFRPKKTRVVMAKKAIRHVIERHPGPDGAQYLPYLPALLAVRPASVRRSYAQRAVVHYVVSDRHGLRVVLRVVDTAEEGEHTVRTCHVLSIRRI